MNGYRRLARAAEFVAHFAEDFRFIQFTRRDNASSFRPLDRGELDSTCRGSAKGTPYRFINQETETRKSHHYKFLILYLCVLYRVKSTVSGKLEWTPVCFIQKYYNLINFSH